MKLQMFPQFWDVKLIPFFNAWNSRTVTPEIPVSEVKDLGEKKYSMLPSTLVMWRIPQDGIVQHFMDIHGFHHS